MGEDATEEKKEKYGCGKLGIDIKKDGLIPSFKLLLLNINIMLYFNDNLYTPSTSL